MYVTYDSRVDAVYIKIIPGKHKVVTVNVDEDIALNLDEQDRLIGIEILDASKRLDLRYLLPVEIVSTPDSSKYVSRAAVSEQKQNDWKKLRRELIQRKKASVPVETVVQHRKNWVEEVSEEYVVMRRGKAGNICTITQKEFEDGTKDSLTEGFKWPITRALRELASSL